MNSKVDIFEARLKAREGDKKDIFEERASLRGKTPSRAKEVAKQGLVGGAQGLLGNLGSLLDLLNLQSKDQLEGEKANYQSEFEILQKMNQPGYKPSFAEIYSLTDDDIAPRFSRIPSEEGVANFLEMLGVNTEPQTTEGKYARRIGKAVGGGASFGASPSALGALGLGALAGEGVEQATDSPLLGAVAETATSLSPSAFSKRIAPFSKKGKSIVEAGRKANLTEKEIAPLIQGKTKLATFGKLARKGSKTQKTFAKIESKLGDAYSGIKEAASTLPNLTPSQSTKLLDGFGKVNKELRTTLKAAPEKQSAINFIQEAMENVRNQGASPEELIGFWQDINQAVNWNSIKGGKKSLAALKKPIAHALEEVSPDLYRHFEDTNKLYSKFKQVSKTLKPDIVDKWLNKGEAGALIFGLATANPWILKKVGGEAAVRTISRELLTNPRLQTLSNKMLQAVRKNKGASASSLLRQTKNLLNKEHPEEDWSFLEVEDLS